MSRFSVVMPAYKTPPKLLISALNSLISQAYPPEEIVVVDDSGPDPIVRNTISAFQDAAGVVRLIVNQSNLGISESTNIGIKAAIGEFIVFCDHDDEVFAGALKHFSDLLDGDPSIDAIYSDQCTVDETGSVTHFFCKPDWSPIYALGAMYPGHLLAVRNEVCRRHKFLSQFDGVQDFEFLLRVSEDNIKIAHLPINLYKWRAIPGSLALGTGEKQGIDQLQARAVNEHLHRQGRTWAAESHSTLPHRLVLNPSYETRQPKVSIIIPSRNQGAILGRCLESLFYLTEYGDYEVILIDNKTTEPAALREISSYPLKHIIFDEDAFNYSRANNKGVKAAAGDFVVFLNNDTEVISCDWLQKMVMYFEDPRIGAVGSTLLYPNNTVQHAGVILGPRGTADHVMRGWADNSDGYAGSLAVSREVSAVTAACMMMRKSLFEEIGGFSEDYAKHYQDVDLCMKVRDRGYDIISVANSRLYHHESLTRKSEGYDLGDRAILLDRWGKQIEAGDPYYGKGFVQGSTDYNVANRGEI
jgi:GT2 family glycosyltransferase